jgi:small subunit ribosomal protein S8
MAGLDTVEVPYSRIKSEIVRIMKREGFIADYVMEGGASKKLLRVYLKYTGEKEPAIRGMQRKSKPGLRSYVASGTIPRVLGGMGIAILSTSGGIMTGKEAKKRNVGGELLCVVW